MKRLLTLFLVLWCSTAWGAGPIDWSKPYARTNPYVAGAGAAAVGGVSYIYSGEATDDYPDTSNSVATSSFIAGRVTTVGGVTITKIGIKIADAETSTECWVAIYSLWSDARLAYSTFTPTTGWNDVTISYAASATTNYTVWNACNGSRKAYRKAAGSGPSYHSSGETYNSTPPLSIGENSDSWSNSFRVGY